MVWAFVDAQTSVMACRYDSQENRGVSAST